MVVAEAADQDREMERMHRQYRQLAMQGASR
jgi:hypothetical protein